MGKFIKQYVVIYSIKLITLSLAFCKSTKALQTKSLLSIAFSVFLIRLITACTVEKIFYMEPLDHLKITLQHFNAYIFLLLYKDLIA